jgi:hypothetical protein
MQTTGSINKQWVPSHHLMHVVSRSSAYSKPTSPSYLTYLNYSTQFSILEKDQGHLKDTMAPIPPFAVEQVCNRSLRYISWQYAVSIAVEMNII